jgi:arginine decarboxylase
MRIANEIFFTKGVGKHKEYLQSFELALRAAGIEQCNLVYVSSIFPPNCKKITKEEGVKKLAAGAITYAVVAKNFTNEPNRLIASSIGVAIPSDPSVHGYLSEHHAYGETDEKAGEYAENLAASMLASTLDIDLNQDSSWDEKEHILKLSGKIYKTFNVTQSAEGEKSGIHTHVVAAAVMLFPSLDSLVEAVLISNPNIIGKVISANPSILGPSVEAYLKANPSLIGDIVTGYLKK